MFEQTRLRLISANLECMANDGEMIEEDEDVEWDIILNKYLYKCYLYVLTPNNLMWIKSKF